MKSMKVINPDLTEQDVKTLTNEMNEIKVEELHEILKHNELANFDPLGEVYRLVSNSQTGKMDFKKLNQAYQTMGFGELRQKDIDILHACLDLNGDG